MTLSPALLLVGCAHMAMHGTAGRAEVEAKEAKLAAARAAFEAKEKAWEQKWFPRAMSNADFEELRARIKRNEFLTKEAMVRAHSHCLELCLGSDADRFCVCCVVRSVGVLCESRGVFSGRSSAQARS